MNHIFWRLRNEVLTMRRYMQIYVYLYLYLYQFLMLRAYISSVVGLVTYP